MTIMRIGQAGQFGVNKDLSQHELPPNIWTDANNIRFIDGTARQVLGYRDLFPSPSVTPYHVLPLTVAGIRTWIYCGAAKIYTVVDGPTHTNITRQTLGVDVDYTATRNSWTSTLLGGIPILNNGVDVPQQWLLTGKATALSAWPATYKAESVRAYKNSLIALNITKGSTNYPYMVKWSHPADPGSVPSTWDETDATKDAGENDLSDGGAGKIIDGMPLRDSFMIYTENNVWRMDYIGGTFVYRFSKVLGMSGALSKNCIAEIDGQHFVLSSSDCIIHDGQSPTSVLDKQTRRALFQEIDQTYGFRSFVFVNRLYNEVHVCYPTLGNSVPNKCMVWNWVDKTVSFKEIPSLNHAACGTVSDTSADLWSNDGETWETDTTLWGAVESSLDRQLSVLASDNTKLYLLDSGTTFAGTTPTSYLERIGMSLGAPEKRKLVKRIRARIYGQTGGTVLVYVGQSADPFGTVTYNSPVTYTIGTTVSVDTFCTGRYIAVKFASGTATQWRLDSYDIDVVESSSW